MSNDWLVADDRRVDGVLDDWRSDNVVVGDLVAGFNGVALDLCWRGWVDGLDRSRGWHGRQDWQRSCIVSVGNWADVS